MILKYFAGHRKPSLMNIYCWPCVIISQYNHVEFFWQGSILHCSWSESSAVYSWKCEYLRSNLAPQVLLAKNSAVFAFMCVCVCTPEEFDRAGRGSRCDEPSAALRQHVVWETHPHICPQTQHCVYFFHCFAFHFKYAWHTFTNILCYCAVCSWHLVYTHSGLCYTQCTGNTSSSQFCHLTFLTIAGKPVSLSSVFLCLYVTSGITCCSAPMPYLIGVHSSLAEVRNCLKCMNRGH